MSNAEMLIYFSNKIYGSNFIKQHSETIMVSKYQNADYSLRKKFYRVIYYNFLHTFVPYFKKGALDSGIMSHEHKFAISK